MFKQSKKRALQAKSEIIKQREKGEISPLEARQRLRQLRFHLRKQAQQKVLAKQAKAERGLLKRILGIK